MDLMKSDPVIFNDPVYLTEEGLRRLKEKLARLKRVLPDFIAEAQRTAEYGDRSDNAEYKEAKSILRRTHRQILSINDQIKRVVIIKSGTNASGTVQLGSIVVLEAEDGTQSTFLILGSRETNPAKGRISNQSPLGAALINHSKGDIVTIHLPPPMSGGRLGAEGDSRKYRIIEIR